jgi:hypothetical protein
MSEPQFENCWIDKDVPLAMIKIGGTEFRLRPMTAGEHQEVRARARVAAPEATTIAEATARSLDGYLIVIGEVCAMLGVYSKIGGEGWNDSRPVTELAVRSLRDSVLFRLHDEANRFFRAGSSGPAESGAGAALGERVADLAMVSSA